MLAILFEELLWTWLGRLMAGLARWSPVARLEAAIHRLPPYAAMVLFILPWALVLPIKLAALWLIAVGRVTAGLLLFIGGEAFTVAFLARLYALCRPALHQLAWFVWAEGIVLGWSRWAHAWLDRIGLLRQARKAAAQLLARARAKFSACALRFRFSVGK